MGVPRGPLIRPALIELVQLDTAATDYDPVLREPKTRTGGDGVTISSSRAEKPAIELHAQIELQQLEDEQMATIGPDKLSKLVLVFHMAELERMDLIDSDSGEPLIRAGDRIQAWIDGSGRRRVVRTPPGLYALQVMDYGPGPAGASDLVRVHFESQRRGFDS